MSVKQKFFIRTIQNELEGVPSFVFEERIGESCKVIAGVEVFVHKERSCRWVATEYSTGLMICLGRTKKSVFEMLEGDALKYQILKRMTVDREGIQKYIDELEEYKRTIKVEQHEHN